MRISNEKSLFLFIFCISVQAHTLDNGVDIAFMNITGYSTPNVFLMDVDNPDGEIIPFTHNFDIGTCYEQGDGSDEVFAACERIKYPPYLDVWQVEWEDQLFSPQKFRGRYIRTFIFL